MCICLSTFLLYADGLPYMLELPSAPDRVEGVDASRVLVAKSAREAEGEAS